MKKNNNGFTLIELVVVIVILGILAVTAAPKFINLQSDGYKSALQGLKGSIESANSLVYSKAVLNNKEDEDSDTLDIAGTATDDDDDIAIVYGYPAAAALSDVLDADFTGDWTISVAGSVATIRQNGAPADSGTGAAAAAVSCKLEYTAATEGNTPSVKVISTGC